ncbi:efflux RND transporter periplasmic adaptor subunit [Nitrobacter sp.]|uniref:efflux RND transporter periplasmic adaptor subunit n=1 Tax=Nitrobacter sp. TaxID=29420 RepID=UPI003F6525BD
MADMTAEAGSGRADQRPPRQDASSPTGSAKVRSEQQQPAVGRDKPAKTPDDAPEETSRQSGIRSTVSNHPILAIVCLGLVVLAIIAGILWYLHARHYESSDDAFIDTRPVLVSPQVTGSIVDVAVTDNQVVKRGELLAKIDPRDYQAAVDQADAQIRQADATLQNLDAQISAQQAQIDRAEKQVAEAQAALKFSEDENRRYQDLVRTGAGTVQRAQQAASDLHSKQAAFAASNAAQIAAQRQIDVLAAQKAAARAQIDQSKAQKDRADADLSRTELRATVDGRATKLTAAVGALASPGQSIMVVVPLDVWVTANFKESQLADMRVGQPVEIEIDAFGRSFSGHIDSIQAGSGTAFSLLPAENATGNYVKVVQRVPVKILFDKLPDVELGPGMSVVPRVTVR